jgi:hypothetical protein
VGLLAYRILSIISSFAPRPVSHSARFKGIELASTGVLSILVFGLQRPKKKCKGARALLITKSPSALEALLIPFLSP